MTEAPGWRDPPTCWDAADAQSVIQIEAEASREAIFEAVHVPLEILKVHRTKLTPTGNPVAENDVLGHVLARSDTNVVPVLGESGAGKSHLVRWLRNRFHRDEPEGFRPVFVPKHRTSLYGVTDLILREFEDEASLDGFRDLLRSARDLDLTDEETVVRLRDAICIGLEYHAERTHVDDDQEGAARDYLRDHLPRLLRDPVFASRYTARSSALWRLAQEKRYGRSEDDAVDEAFEFVPDDLAISVDDVNRAGADAKTLAGQLVSQQESESSVAPNLLDLAVQMMNDQIPAAVKEVFGVGGQDLKEILVKIRQAVHRTGQHVVLLIEDFSMFQGLQGGLIDAITVAGSGDAQDAAPGEEGLCHLTTVIAVTTGYYRDHIPETLKTRASQAFLVSPNQDANVTTFAASYLRTIRAGVAEVGQAYAERRAPVNVCEECPVREDCHSGFGHEDGVGLFPFNDVFLDRARHAVHGEDFNARMLLIDVLLPVLTDGARDIVNGTFPSEELASRFDAIRHAPSADAVLELQKHGQKQKRVDLASLFAPHPGPQDLPQAIHAAFRVPPTGTGGATASSSPPVRNPARTSHREPDPRADVPDLVAATDAWRRGEMLSQANRREIRKLVYQAVRDRVSFDHAYKPSEWTDQRMVPAFVEAGVVIDGNRPSTKGLALLEIEADNVEDVAAVQALVWIDERPSWREVPDGFRRAARLNARLDCWAAEISRALGFEADARDELSALVCALEFTAAFRGARPLGGSGSVDERIARLLSQRRAGGRRAELEREDERLGDLNNGPIATLMRRLLRHVAQAQGVTGSPAAIDVVAIRSVMSAVPTLQADVSDAPRGLKEALAAVASVLERTEQHAELIRDQLPDHEMLGGEDAASLAGDLVELLETTPVPARLKEQVRDAADAIQKKDLSLLQQVQDLFQRWDELQDVDKLGLVGGGWWAAAERVGTFLDACNEALTAAMPAGAEALVTDGASEVGQAWRGWLRRAQELQQEMETAS